MDGIFTRLGAKDAAVLRATDVIDANKADVDLDTLKDVLSTVNSELKLANANLQKLYEEANHVCNRLAQMEENIISQQKNAAQQNNDDASDDEEGGAVGDVVVEKHFFIGASGEDRLSKVQEAKMLTQSLLESIKSLSQKIKESSTVNYETGNKTPINYHA